MKTLQIIVATSNLITKILEEKGLAQMKTPQELTVCVSLRLPITSLTEFSLPSFIHYLLPTPIQPGKPQSDEIYLGMKDGNTFLLSPVRNMI